MHAPITLAALRAGKHVYVEKPLGVGAKDAAEIAAAIEKAGGTVEILPRRQTMYEKARAAGFQLAGQSSESAYKTKTTADGRPA